MSRQSRSQGGGSAPLDSKSRQNEFFVHREGIDRDVITADICTYLGNDALVKPGTWLDEKTGIEHHGYYVTAYRNLTTAMIDDLKADSARWEQERRKHQNSGVRYQGSDLQYHNRSQPGYSGGGGARPNYDSGGYQGGSAGYGGTTSKQTYPAGYGQPSGYSSGATGGYPAQGYPSGQPGGYPSGGMDPRASYPSGGAGMGGMPTQMPGVSYQTGGGVSYSKPVQPSAAYAVQQDYEMTDAGAQPAYGASRAAGYSQNPGGYSYGSNPGQPQAYPPGGQMTQPIDMYYGRGPGGTGAYPPGTAAPYPESATVSGGSMGPYSPGPEYDAQNVSRASAASPGAQAQPSSSGPDRRERERTSEYRKQHHGDYDSRDRDSRRDRERDDRRDHRDHTEKRRR